MITRALGLVEIWTFHLTVVLLSKSLGADSFPPGQIFDSLWDYYCDVYIFHYRVKKQNFKAKQSSPKGRNIVEHTNRKQVLKVCLCSFWIGFHCERAVLTWDNAYGQFLDRKRTGTGLWLCLFPSSCSVVLMGWAETDVGRGFALPLSSLHLLIRLICSVLVPGGSSLFFEEQ